MSENTPSPEHQDENQLIAERREKLSAMRTRQALGGPVAFPNDFKPAHHADALHTAHGGKDAETLLAEKHTVRIAGRMVLKRVMGKASFATLQDSTGRMQVYVKGEEIGTDIYEDFKHWDLGDIVGAEGHLFKTKTGELSVHISSIRILTKSLRPLPDKFHGIHDQEIKYRQRYIDLITDDTSRQRFMARSKAVSSIREFMVQHGFLEVETPMLHPIPGGANAKPNAVIDEKWLTIATPVNGNPANPVVNDWYSGTAGTASPLSTTGGPTINGAPSGRMQIGSSDGSIAPILSKKVYLPAGDYELRYWYQSTVIYPEYEPAYICGSVEGEMHWAISSFTRSFGSSPTIGTTPAGTNVTNAQSARAGAYLVPVLGNPQADVNAPVVGAFPRPPRLPFTGGQTVLIIQKTELTSAPIRVAGFSGAFPSPSRSLAISG